MYYRKSNKLAVGIILFCIGFAMHLIFITIIPNLNMLWFWETGDRVVVILLGIAGGGFMLIGIIYMIRGYMENYLLRIFPPPGIPPANVVNNPPIHIKPGLKHCVSCNALISLDNDSCPQCDVE